MKFFSLKKLFFEIFFLIITLIQIKIFYSLENLQQDNGMKVIINEGSKINEIIVEEQEHNNLNKKEEDYQKTNNNSINNLNDKKTIQIRELLGEMINNKEENTITKETIVFTEDSQKQVDKESLFKNLGEENYITDDSLEEQIQALLDKQIDEENEENNNELTNYNITNTNNDFINIAEDTDEEKEGKDDFIEYENEIQNFDPHDILTVLVSQNNDHVSIFAI